MADAASIHLSAPLLGDDSHPAPGYQVTVLLTAKDLTGPANGFQVFLAFERLDLTFRPDLSSYDDSVFDSHIRSMINAEVAPGTIHLDGTTLMPGGPASTTSDTPLATLVFTVGQTCNLFNNSIEFTHYLTFGSEMSYFGSPLTTSTNVLHGPVDTVPPSVVCAADVVTPAAPGGDGSTSIVLAAPTLSDNFTVTGFPPFIASTTRSDGLSIFDPFPVGTTTVTWLAYDICGNSATCIQNVTVLPYTELQVTLELPGSEPGERCVTLAAYDCNNPADPVETTATVEFIDHDANPLTPVRFSGPVPFALGAWSSVNAKDRQHTKWGSGSSVTNEPGSVLALDTIVMEAGDNDDDGDVDINDLTWLVSTFGEPGSPSCGPEFARDADFSNDGFVATEDFSLLSAQWLTISQAKVGCVAPSTSGPTDPAPKAKLDRRTSIATSQLDSSRRRADLNGDGVFDWRDVQKFERSRGLASGLSERLRAGH